MYKDIIDDVRFFDENPKLSAFYRPPMLEHGEAGHFILVVICRDTDEISYEELELSDFCPNEAARVAEGFIEYGWSTVSNRTRGKNFIY